MARTRPELSTTSLQDLPFFAATIEIFENGILVIHDSCGLHDYPLTLCMIGSRQYRSQPHSATAPFSPSHTHSLQTPQSGPEPASHAAAIPSLVVRTIFDWLVGRKSNISRILLFDLASEIFHLVSRDVAKSRWSLYNVRTNAAKRTL